jgi:hypothetical protein
MQFDKVIKIIAGIAAFLGALFSIYKGYHDYRPPVPKLEAAVVNVEHVSARTPIAGVKINLSFRDQPVSDLWLCRIRLQNTGGVTLFTTGPRPNTQNPIVIRVPENCEILQIEPKGMEPKNSGFEARIGQTKGDKHQFETSFEQWRQGETIEALLYLAMSGEPSDKPKLIPKGRPIPDGNVVAVDLSTVTAPPTKIAQLDKAVGTFWAAIIRFVGLATLWVTLMFFVPTGTIRERLQNVFPKSGWGRSVPLLIELLFLAGFMAAVLGLVP